MYGNRYMRSALRGRGLSALRRSAFLLAGSAVAVLLSAAPSAAVQASPGAGSPGEQEAPGTGSVAGTVLNAGTGAPLHAAVARVEETGQVSVTDRTGAFLLMGVPAGAQVIVVQHIGYRTERRTVDVRAGQTVRVELELEPAPVTLDELVVTAALGARALSEALRPVVAVRGRELERKLEGTVAATLREEPGLAVRSMGPAPARPVIRGLGGDRILILEDGERVGDVSSASADHAVAVDPLSARQIEVVRGPAALFYGSNALGGVVNVVRDEIPRALPDRTVWEAAVHGQTATPGVAGSGSVVQPVGPVALRLEGTGRTAGDLRTPLGTTPNTDLLTYNGAASGSWIGDWGHAGMGLRLFRSEYGIPPDPVAGHPGGVDIELRRASWRGEAHWNRALGPFSELNLTAGWTDYHHLEIESGGIVGTEFGLITHSGEVQAMHEAWGPFARGGIGVRLQEVRYGADVGRGPIRADEYSAGMFVLQEAELGPWEVQVGGRYDLQRSLPRNIGLVRGVPARDRTFHSLSGSVAVLHALDDGIRIGMSGARAFRTPSAEELFSQGPHLATYTFEVGNPELRAETGYGLDLFLRVDRPAFQAELAGFWNEIDDFVQPTNTGMTRGNLFIYRFTNTDARFLGAEGRAEWRVMGDLRLDGTASFVHGREPATGEPLPFIPPLSGHVDVRYEPERWLAMLGWRWSLEQDRVPSPPELPFGQSYCPGPEPEPGCRPVPGEFRSTPGYGLLDAAAAFRWEMGGRSHSVTVRLENLTNAEHRNHLSWIKELAPEPGRNLSLLYRVGL